MIDMGLKHIEFRNDTPQNRKKLLNKSYFTGFRGPCFSTHKVPNMDVDILDTFFLPNNFLCTLKYPNNFIVTLKGPLIGLVLGSVRRRGGPTTFVRWSPTIRNKIFY